MWDENAHKIENSVVVAASTHVERVGEERGYRADNSELELPNLPILSTLLPHVPTTTKLHHHNHYNRRIVYQAIKKWIRGLS